MKKFLKSSIVPIIAVVVIAALAVFVLRLQRSDDTAFAYHLKWSANAGFAGDLYADTYGYYINDGLKVDVVQGGPDKDAITALLNPNSHTLFAVASADQVIRAVYNDTKPNGGASLRVVAQIYAANPVLWIYRPQKIGLITDASQLRGKKIGVAIGDNDETIMKTYLRTNNIPQTGLVGIQFDYAPFTSGAVDLFPVYSNTQAIELEHLLAENHEEVGFFDPSIVGPHVVSFVANSVVTTSRAITDHCDLVASFMQATLRGWQDALKPENLDRTVHAVSLATGDGGPSDDIVAEEVRATAKLVFPSPDHQIGAIDVAGWTETEKAMLEGGQLIGADGKPLPPSTPSKIKAYLTSQFLPGTQACHGG